MTSRKFICAVCGYVYEGETPPEKCPVCCAQSSRFVEQQAESSPSPVISPDTHPEEVQPDTRPKADQMDTVPEAEVKKPLEKTVTELLHRRSETDTQTNRQADDEGKLKNQ